MKKVLGYQKFLEEVSLNLGELGKIRNGGTRGDILIGKLMGDKKLITNNNKSIEVDKMKQGEEWVEPEEAIEDITTDGEYDIDKAKSYFTKSNRYKPVFRDEDGDEFKLTQFKKTKEFGSAGAGRLTSQFESVQCIFLGVKQAYPNTNLNSRNLLDFFKRYQRLEGADLFYLPEGVVADESLMEDFLQDRNWVESFCQIPNKLWARNFHMINRNYVYSIYHAGYKGEDSPYMAIIKKYRQFAKEDGFSDININKYCPADVYLVSNRHRDIIIDNIQRSTSIVDLNTRMDGFFDNKILLPLSLKKVSVDCDFKIITNREVGKELPDFIIKSFMISPGLKGIGSKISTDSIWKHRNNKNVDIKSRRMNFDSSDTSKKQNIDGEVEGSSSRHGKISFKGIKRILDLKRVRYPDIQELQSYSDLQPFTRDQLSTKIIETIDEIEALDLGGKVEIRPIRRDVDISTENKMISKLQSLQIILCVAQIFGKPIEDDTDGPKEANDAVTKMMRYALSIQNDKFDTPRYLRVV